jgi:AraC-like DNA-binding protein
MGRKSVLSLEQWTEIERRILVDNEQVQTVAKEFGVNESTVRRKIKPTGENPMQKILHGLAEAKAKNDMESKRISEQIAELPYQKREIVLDLSRRLANVSNNLMSAAEYGSATALRLNAIANIQLQKIDDSAPDPDIVRMVHGFTETANKAAYQGLELLKANKDMMTKAEEGEPVPVAPVYKIVNA